MMSALSDAEEQPGPTAAAWADGGKAQLLYRFFESEWFSELIALQYLYQSETKPEVCEFLCAKVLAMPEHLAERYLMQLTQLATSRPVGGPMERMLVLLASRSLRLALKVCAWRDMPRSSLPHAGVPPAHSAKFPPADLLAAVRPLARAPQEPAVRAAAGAG